MGHIEFRLAGPPKRYLLRFRSLFVSIMLASGLVCAQFGEHILGPPYRPIWLFIGWPFCFATSANHFSNITGYSVMFGAIDVGSCGVLQLFAVWGLHRFSEILESRKIRISDLLGLCIGVGMIILLNRSVGAYDMVTNRIGELQSLVELPFFVALVVNGGVLMSAIQVTNFLFSIGHKYDDGQIRKRGSQIETHQTG